MLLFLVMASHNPLTLSRDIGSHACHGGHLFILVPALMGQLDVQHYRSFIGNLASHPKTAVMVCSSLEEVPTEEDILSIENSYPRLSFDSCTCISHSTGVQLARMVTVADKLVTLDAIDMHAAFDGTRESRVLLQAYCDRANDMVMADAMTLNPLSFTVDPMGQVDMALETHGVRPRIVAKQKVKLSQAHFADIFDQEMQLLLKGSYCTKFCTWVADHIHSFAAKA